MDRPMGRTTWADHRPMGQPRPYAAPLTRMNGGMIMAQMSRDLFSAQNRQVIKYGPIDEWHPHLSERTGLVRVY